ncbi:Stf0 family sulfotransferase [Pleurocapsa sp. PCC 7319]|uniref:Stf0 family sulfotransferase n=1 Tax=Pleurocapsa sp. PCC 7319 TaxID=118161 RepID=UPI0003450644|nr:Stf0 family sulfotransferase [Pleurocapsa sp. PCC 7319]
MELAQIFQDIEETQFLNKLSSQDRLFFIGDTEPLEYIKNFFENLKQIDNNHYCHLSACNLDNILAIPQGSQQYRAIVIVSFKNEAVLFQEVKQKADKLKINIPTLRLFADVFINHLCKQKLWQSTVDRLEKPKVSYAILTTPRSGSTYFCELLDSTGIAGHPYEHLRLAAQELTRHCNFDYLRLLYNLMRYRTTSNGVFGTKFISHFLFEFQRAKPNFKQIFSSIDKYILLVRKDKVAQAVSLVLAQKTEIWHLHSNLSQNNPNYQAYQSKLGDIEINDVLLSEVEQKFQFIQNQEARLKKILTANQIEPLVLVYEDIVEAPELQINRILNFLEIEKPEQYQMRISSGIKKMPSNISQEIIRQFKQRKSTVC